jgi:hypothetical protein
MTMNSVSHNEARRLFLHFDTRFTGFAQTHSMTAGFSSGAKSGRFGTGSNPVRIAFVGSGRLIRRLRMPPRCVARSSVARMTPDGLISQHGRP